MALCTDPNKRPNVPVREGEELFFNYAHGCWAFRQIPSYLKKRQKTGTNKKSTGYGKNESLINAKKEKNDLFYTSLSDISKEMGHYHDFFKGKTVYCPCDKVFDKGHSMFIEYFVSEFKYLGLKKVVFTQYNPNGLGSKLEFTSENVQNITRGVDRYIDENLKPMRGNGSINSSECLEIMKECDVVVTSPGGSKFLDFLDTLITYEKKFIILGDENQIPCKIVFEQIKNGKLWLGFEKPVKFRIPMDKYKDYKDQYIEDGVAYQKQGKKCWYTNIEHEKRSTLLELDEKYTPDKYTRFDNYDAINVRKVKQIPSDYKGVMGVPITFLENYNPTQFRIIKASDVAYDSRRSSNIIRDTDGGDKTSYARICIQQI